MEVREYSFGSPEYELAVELRRQVLRRPLGLEFDPAQLALEGADRHFAVSESGAILATLILTPIETGFKMRQVAVAFDEQGKGLGRLLVEFSEGVARQAGATEITLHARVTAVPFYLRLGYQPVGEPFEEVGIPHLAMVKLLV